jgi:hypothetical protein
MRSVSASEVLNTTTGITRSLPFEVLDRFDTIGGAVNGIETILFS